MNLLIDSHVFDEVPQGSRTYLKGLYNELIRLMPESSFYFAGYNKSSLQTEIGNHPNVHFVQLKRNKLLRLVLEFPLLVRKYRIDYAHFQYISPPFKNCKQIVTTHDILFKDFKKFFPLKYRIVNNFLFFISAKRADMLLTVSEYSKQRIAVHYHISEEMIGVTPNGVSKEFFEPVTSTESNALKTRYSLDRYILYVSRIEPRKNHLTLLKAFSELKLWEHNYKLVFIGKKDFSFGDLDIFFENCSEECKRNTLHLQSIEHSELLTFYKNASLFVYPSFAEGFGIPPIEAISCGVSTLCSNATAMSDFTFLDSDLFTPDSIDELKSKIMQKLSSPTDANRTEKLKQIVTEKYSWNQTAKTFISLLNNSK